MDNPGNVCANAYEPFQSYCNRPDLGYTASPAHGNTFDPMTMRGCFNRVGAKVSFANISDGTTNTIMVGEILPAQNDHVGGPGNTWCRTPSIQYLQRWTCFDGGASHVSTLAPINYVTDEQVPCDNHPERSWQNWHLSWGFKSRHPKGANMLFADGSVHFVAEGLQHDLYQLLGCRNDGKHIEEWE